MPKNPQIRHLPSRHTFTVDRGVEEAAHVRGREMAAVDAESDQATRELVHDHKHPVAPEHHRPTKQVDAPETIGRVADERQPGGPTAARGDRAIVFRQHPVHDVPVDLDTEGVRDDARDARAAKARIARPQLDNRMHERFVRTFRPGLPWTCSRGKQPTILALHQSLMEGQEC